MGNWTPGEETFAGAIGLGKYIKYKALAPVLPGQVQNASATAAANNTAASPGTNVSPANSGGGSVPSPSPGASPTPTATANGTGPAAIFAALIKIGASPAQAIGIMANMINESSLNPEAAAMDTNGKMSYGLVQWNAGSFPNAGSLVTGHPANDIAAQVNYLAQTGGLRAASGSTGSQVASNFAANYERCVGCEPGGSQNNSRVANVPGLAKQLGVKTT